MTDILNLPNWIVLGIENAGDDYRIRAKCTEEPRACPHCGVLDPKLQGFGTKDQLFLDLPVHGKRVGILCNRQRYRCLECNRTFFQQLKVMDEVHRATKRLIDYAKRESLSRTFASVANEIGVDEKTIRLLFQEHVDELEKTHKFITPTWLGIDEIHILGKPRCVLGNIQEKTVFDILKNRSQKLVGQYLSNLKGKDAIELVAMDMWRPYKDSVQAILPDVQIVVDKFHVVRMANQALDTVRKSVRGGLTPTQRRQLMHDRFILLRRNEDPKADERMILDLWTSNFPVLGEAYQLKEDFFNIWNANDRGMAEDWYVAWRKRISPALEPYFQDLTTALDNWHDEIFAYFDYPVTNAYTEALNGIIKLIQRVGRGYSFDAVRAKVLYSEGLHKRVRPIYRRMKKEEETVRDIRDGITGSYGKATNIGNVDNQSIDVEIILPAGVDISTLIEWLKKQPGNSISTDYSG